MTLFIDEGKWMVQAARKYNRVVVVGTQRRHGKGVAAARKVIESGQLGKIHAVRMGAYRNIYPGFGKTPVEDPPPDLDYDMWLGPAPKKPYTSHRALYHFRWFWDYSGGQMTNLAAHSIDQMLYVMNVKAPTLVSSHGGRFALEDDGETPDLQDALVRVSRLHPSLFASARLRRGRAIPPPAGPVSIGTKGTLVLRGDNLLIPEMKSNPDNPIPQFLGHPVGGPRTTDQRPAPYFEAPPGRPRRGEGRPRREAEDTMALNKRDWMSSIRSRKLPFCDVEGGHRVATATHLANISLRLGRSVRWDPEKETIIGDKQAAAMLVRPYRKPWDQVLASLL